MAVPASVAAARAEREYRDRLRDIEHEHPMLNLAEKVTHLDRSPSRLPRLRKARPQAGRQKDDHRPGRGLRTGGRVGSS